MEENAGIIDTGEGGGPRAGQSSWRGVAVPVVLAVVLWVAATLLLGGVFRPGWGSGGLIGDAPGRGCCAPGLADGGGR